MGEEKEESLGEDSSAPAEGGEISETSELELSNPELTQDSFEEALREKEQFRAMAQRAQADLVNYRNRVSQELEESRRTVRFHVLNRFLKIADDLALAVENIPEETDSTWAEGISLVQRNLENTFEAEGVQKIESLGSLFDPHEHEALMYEEQMDVEEGIIVNVIQEGYRIDDRILRPARVVVAQAPIQEQDEVKKNIDDSCEHGEQASQEPTNEDTEQSTEQEDS